MTHRPRPEEPPTSGYTRRTTDREPFAPYVWIALGIAVLCVIVGAIAVRLSESPARGAADHAAVVSTATPGTAVPRKPAEYAPPQPEELPGDGMWLVRKHIKPGLWQSELGALCYWERLGGLSGEPVDLLDNGGFRKGPLLVDVRASDYAFSSVGCGKWVLVR